MWGVLAFYQGFNNMKKLWLAGLVALLLTGTVAHADAPDHTPPVIHGGSDSAPATLHADETGAPGATSTENVAAQSNEGIIRLTPDKTKVIHLDEDAGGIIVTNPMHAAVVLDSPRTLVIMPRQPGTTAFSVMNKQGNIIFQRNIVVTAAQENYVRIRRMCGGGAGECVQNAYYYCPDGCYEVMPVEGSPELPGVPQPRVTQPAAGLLNNAATPQAGSEEPAPSLPLPDPEDDIPVTDDPVPEAQ
jgi:hypothetical protein